MSHRKIHDVMVTISVSIFVCYAKRKAIQIFKIVEKKKKQIKILGIG